MRLSEIKQLLPGVFQQTLREGTPQLTLLELMEALHEPSEQVLAQLDAVFDPRRTADEFVPFLAVWVDLARLFDVSPGARPQPRSQLRSPISSGLGRLRELVANAAYLSHWRGTKKGLLLFLQTATGSRGFEVEEEVRRKGEGEIPGEAGGRADGGDDEDEQASDEIEGQVPGDDGRPVPFHIRVRAPAEAAPHRALIARIIEQEKPAYVTYELEFKEPVAGA